MSSKISDILKSRDLRTTAVREKVLELFLKAPKAITNRDIELEFDHIDRITLYRTLKAFEEKGLIHKIDDGSGTPKFAKCIDNCDESHHHDDHVHFHCNDCGDTFCIEEVEVPYIKSPSKHLVKKTNIVLNGTCESCQ